jgi:hypothetical protein
MLERDRKWLVDKMESGKLFATVLGRSHRHAIFKRVIQWPYLIPSLKRSLFADFSDMVQLQKSLMVLIPGRDHQHYRVSPATSLTRWTATF